MFPEWKISKTRDFMQYLFEAPANRQNTNDLCIVRLVVLYIERISAWEVVTPALGDVSAKSSGVVACFSALSNHI